ncbi:hypothetical protein [Tepidibacter mesophilus]|uniref:hypothetical protein n=1 Tax=Tepidibacter mesophilus TaxID=655607 RepID=UPI000C069C9C|nr:hypothetical protein [Tepidibacter mesophilus]
MNDGNKKYVSVLRTLLTKVKGFDYVPENLRSLTFIEAAQKLINAHFGMNNFYNEPPAIQYLESLGTVIPYPGLGICITATIIVKVGNFYGVSRNAQSYANEILEKIYPDKWKYYFDDVFIGSEDLLWKISCNDDRTDNWCNVVIRYKLDQIEVKNNEVKKLLVESSKNNRGVVSKIARKLYDNLNN